MLKQVLEIDGIVIQSILAMLANVDQGFNSQLMDITTFIVTIQCLLKHLVRPFDEISDLQVFAHFVILSQVMECAEYLLTT